MAEANCRVPGAFPPAERRPENLQGPRIRRVTEYLGPRRFFRPSALEYRKPNLFFDGRLAETTGAPFSTSGWGTIPLQFEQTEI